MEVESGLPKPNQSFDGVISANDKSNKTTTAGGGQLAKSGLNQQGKRANTSGIVRPQYQVRTDGCQQRIDHYINLRKMEPKRRRLIKLE